VRLAFPEIREFLEADLKQNPTGALDVAEKARK
jgi:hypothetical protein